MLLISHLLKAISTYALGKYALLSIDYWPYGILITLIK